MATNQSEHMSTLPLNNSDTELGVVPRMGSAGFVNFMKLYTKNNIHIYPNHI